MPEYPGESPSPDGIGAAYARPVEATIPQDVAIVTMAPAALDAWLTRWVPERSFTLNKMFWIGGGASGHYDIGLFDASGNALWRKGETAAPAASSANTETVASPNGIAVIAGTTYYVAWGAETTVPNIFGVSLVSAALSLDYTGAKRQFVFASGYTAGTGLAGSYNVASGGVQSAKVPKIHLRSA